MIDLATAVKTATQLKKKKKRQGLHFNKDREEVTSATEGKRGVLLRPKKSQWVARPKDRLEGGSKKW